MRVGSSSASPLTGLADRGVLLSLWWAPLCAKRAEASRSGGGPARPLQRGFRAVWTGTTEREDSDTSLQVLTAECLSRVPGGTCAQGWGSAGALGTCGHQGSSAGSGGVVGPWVHLSGQCPTRPPRRPRPPSRSQPAVLAWPEGRLLPSLL